MSLSLSRPKHPFNLRGMIGRVTAPALKVGAQMSAPIAAGVHNFNNGVDQHKYLQIKDSDHGGTRFLKSLAANGIKRAALIGVAAGVMAIAVGAMPGLAGVLGYAGLALMGYGGYKVTQNIGSLHKNGWKAEDCAKLVVNAGTIAFGATGAFTAGLEGVENQPLVAEVQAADAPEPVKTLPPLDELGAQAQEAIVGDIVVVEGAAAPVVSSAEPILVQDAQILSDPAAEPEEQVASAARLVDALDNGIADAGGPIDTYGIADAGEFVAVPNSELASDIAEKAVQTHWDGHPESGGTIPASNPDMNHLLEVTGQQLAYDGQFYNDFTAEARLQAAGAAGNEVAGEMAEQVTEAIEAGFTLYEVQGGDSLWKIVSNNDLLSQLIEDHSTLSDNQEIMMLIEQIQTANGIENVNQIGVGDIIKIPNAAALDLSTFELRANWAEMNVDAGLTESGKPAAPKP